MSKRKTNRRRFLAKSAVVATAVTFSAPAILRGRNLNEKLNIAVIGAGGRGGANRNAVSSENIVALCDVNENNLNAAGAAHQKGDQVRRFSKTF